MVAIELKNTASIAIHKPKEKASYSSVFMSEYGILHGLSSISILLETH